MRAGRVLLVFTSLVALNAGAFAGEIRAELSFRQAPCGKSFYYGDRLRCDCPPGNSSLPCLKSARLTIRPAENELGGRGYLVVHAQLGPERYVLSDGRWLPVREAGPNAFSAVFPALSGVVSVDLPLPSAQDVRDACKLGEPVTLLAFFGTATREDVEMVARMRLLAAKGERRASDDSLLWTRARMRTIRQGNDGWSRIAVLTCGEAAR